MNWIKTNFVTLVFLVSGTVVHCQVNAKPMPSNAECTNLINAGLENLNAGSYGKTFNVILQLSPFEEAMELNIYRAFFNLQFSTYSKLGLTTQAENLLDEYCIRVKPVYPDIAFRERYNRTFQLNFENNNMEVAIESLEKLISHVGAQGDAYAKCGRLNDLGICYQKIGAFSKADECFQNAQSLVNDFFQDDTWGDWDIYFAIRDNRAKNLNFELQPEASLVIYTDGINKMDSLMSNSLLNFSIRKFRTNLNVARISIRQNWTDIAKIQLEQAREFLDRNSKNNLGEGFEHMRHELNVIQREYLLLLGKTDEAASLESSIMRYETDEDLELRNGLKSAYQMLIDENSKQTTQERLLLENKLKLEESQKKSTYILFGLISAFVVVAFVLIARLRRRKSEALIKEKELTDKEYKLERLRTEKLEVSLENSQRNIQHLALSISRQKEVIIRLYELAKDLKKGNSEGYQIIEDVTETLKTELALDQGKIEVERQIQLINNGFWDQISSKFPALSELNRELCAQLAINLSNKQIALLRGVSPDSVTTAKMRLRKKMGFETNEELSYFLREAARIS